jgi:APA family basic amino acid/polyamine antiporter
MGNSEQHADATTGDRHLKKHLSLWDTVSIIVGIVVGTAIFRSPTLVFQNVSDLWGVLGVWMLGGGLCLCGALCYAELATTFPRNGGDYEYLSQAFGRWMGFLFGWAQLAVFLSGSIGAMAYAFADYGSTLWSLSPSAMAFVASAAIAVLTVANVLGVVVGKSLQNFLTCAKIVGLALVVFAGLFWGPNNAFPTGPIAATKGPGLGLALVFVLYAYGGWNDAVFVAAEVHDQRRNLPRALLCGIAGITILYLAVNFVYLKVLGLEAARQSAAPAADVMQQAVGAWGAKAISVLVMVSALGAINGTILVGSRVYATIGEDYHLFAWLGKWNQRTGAPVAAIVLQGCFAMSLVVAVGTDLGRGGIDRMLESIGLAGLPWDEYFGGFETLVAGTAPVFWTFFLLTGLSLFILRVRHPERHRPFSVPWFPLPPIVFCCTCGYMLYSSLAYAKSLSLLGVVPLAVGIPLYLLSRRFPKQHDH